MVEETQVAVRQAVPGYKGVMGAVMGQHGRGVRGASFGMVRKAG